MPGEVIPFPRREVEQAAEPRPEINVTISGPARYRPLLPVWLSDRGQRRQAAAWAGRHVAHQVAFHALRAPWYAARLVWRALAGGRRLAVIVGRWVFDLEAAQVMTQAGAADHRSYAMIRAQRAATIRLRLTVVGLAVVAVLIAALVVAAVAAAWLQALLVCAAVVALARLGSPPGRPLVTPAQISEPRAARLTAEAVGEALEAIGVARLRAEEIGYPYPGVVRDGDGWAVEVDLPHGVDAAEVVARRAKLASALRRPLGAVWPVARPSVHPGRLSLWVGDCDVSQRRAAAWPLIKSGSVDVFEPVPFGVDPRGTPVGVRLLFAAGVIGAVPRMGKTFALRLLGCAAALDPTVELHIYELKGTGDLAGLAAVAHAYTAGDDDDNLEYLLADLRALQADMRSRARVMSRLPAEVCPTKQVTRELANRAELGLHPVVVLIDECHILFEADEQAVDIVTDLVKRGPAVGITVWLATQRPDAAAIPPPISANVGTRYALRVTTQIANDMVLGSGAYRSGLRATEFSRDDKGLGILVEGVDPQTVRTYPVDLVDAERVVARARRARELAGRLTGYAAGVRPPRKQPRDIASDVLAVFGDDTWAGWDTLAERLAERDAERYAAITAGEVSAAVRALGVPSVAGKRGGRTRQGCRRAALEQALAAGEA